MNEGKNVLIYTDIGDDVDDALALSYLIEKTAHRLCGIIITHPNLDYSAGQAKAICDLYQVGIPIIQGSTTPLNRHTFHYSNDLADQVSSLTKHIKKLDILAIGPCTDLAQTLLGSQKVQNKTSQIVFQGSLTAEGLPDQASYNFRCDMYAAQMCMKNEIPKIFISKEEAYRNPMREADFMSFSRYTSVNRYLYTKALERMEKFKNLDEAKQKEIYGRDSTILSFPYDLLAAKKL